MQKLRNILIPLLLIYLNTTLAQNTDTHTNGRFAIKYTPTSLINLDYPSYDFSLEYLKSKKLSYELTIGFSRFHPAYLSYSDTQFIHNRVFKLGFELKRYNLFSNKESDYSGSYAAIQAFFQFRQFNNYLTFGDTTTTGVKPNTDNFSETESVFGINFKIGKEFIYRHFIFDCWTGLGLKYRYVNVADINFNPNHYKNDFHPGPDFSIAAESYLNTLSLINHPGLAINLPLGFKIGYVF